MCKKYYNISILAKGLLKFGGFMSIKTHSSDYNYVLIFEEDCILFRDLDQIERRNYKVDPDDAEQLHRIANIAITDAAALLGKIEEIRIQGSARNFKLRKIEPTKLIQTLALILLSYDWRDVYRTIRDAKHHEIRQLCNSESPIMYFENLM